MFMTEYLILQDSNKNRNKIIFDDDINDIKQFQTKEKEKKKNRDLFDDADDDKNDNEPVWDNHKFDSNKNFTEKVKHLYISINK